MNILFVCTGNTCRSPMAEGYLKAKALPLVSVKSRGLSAGDDGPCENARLSMAEIGVDISEHISQPLNMGDIAWADKIICMSLSHKTALSMFANPEKLFVLGEGIPDPFGGDMEIYRECRNAITEEINVLELNGFFSEVYVAALNKEDIKAVAELERVCFSEPWSENTLLQSLENGISFFTAKENGKVLGYVGISCVLDEGYVTNIAVFPEYRKKGVATALIERLFSLARDSKLSFISLEVRPSNTAAIALYEKMGFKKEGQRKGFYRNPVEDAYIMTKRF